MNQFLFVATLLVTLFILVAIWRIAVGPTIFDRVIATAQAVANGVVVLLLVSFLFGRAEMFVDIAISLALFAFLLPIGVGKYLEQRGPE